MGEPINVAIIGVGNCASSLVQGVEFYKDAHESQTIPGLMHPVLGDYHIRDINFTVAIDIDANKVGRDLSEAIYTKPNNTYRFADVPHKGVTVQRGMTHDGLGKYLSEVIEKAPGATTDIVSLLRQTNTHVVVSYLPVGSEEATKWYVEQVLAAGCAFVNCIPVFIAREDYWAGRFPRARAADHRRRHQVAGRRDDPAPAAGAAVPRPRCARRSHVPAQLRWQHGLPQHARARAAGVQEDLEDECGDLADRLRAAGRGHPRRAVGPRAVAGGPQVVPHPDGGHHVRQRPASTSSASSRSGTAPTRRAW